MPPQQIYCWYQAEWYSWHNRRKGFHPEEHGQADENLMRFNKAKCKVFHLGQSSPRHKHRLREELIERSPVEKNLRSWRMKSSMKSSGLHQWRGGRGGQQEEGGNFPPLLCPWEASSGVLCPSLGSPVEKEYGAVGMGPEEGQKDDQRAGELLQIKV